ncbi:glycosyltransferase [Anaerotruncus sp. X29]|nr:glycosyltransferase [Anaerotruncus sp. X29]
MKHTVLIVSNAYPPNFIGGAEIIAHNQAKALARAGHRVVVLAGDTYSSHHQYELYKEHFEGICVYRIRMGAENFSSDCVNFFNDQVNQDFENIVRQYKPDVLHVHNIIGLSLGIIDLAKDYGMRVVITLHDHWGYCFKNTRLLENRQPCEDVFECSKCMQALTGNQVFIPMRVRCDYFRYILKKVDVFISPSSYLAEKYLEAGFPIEKMNIIWNGIDVAHYETLDNVPSAKIRFTYVGYFGKHKGILTMLEAAASSCYKDKLEINLIGDGEEKETYERFIEQHGLRNQVKFWGKVDNARVKSVYEHTDVFFIASIWPENQPVSITEAMICGKPVIASRLGGSLELVKEGETGLLFEAGNAEDLKNKVAFFFEHPEKIVEFGENAKRTMKNYSFDKQILKILEKYEEPSLKSLQNRSGVSVAFEGESLPNRIADRRSDRECYYLLSWIPHLEDLDIVVLREDSQMSLDEVQKRIQAGEIIVAPEARADLVQLLQKENCGLYYTEQNTAFAYVSYLLDRPHLMQNLKIRSRAADF